MKKLHFIDDQESKREKPKETRTITKKATKRLAKNALKTTENGIQPGKDTILSIRKVN